MAETSVLSKCFSVVCDYTKDSVIDEIQLGKLSVQCGYEAIGVGNRLLVTF